MPFRVPLLKEAAEKATTSKAFWCVVLGSTLAVGICSVHGRVS